MKKTVLLTLLLATLVLLVWGGMRAWQRQQAQAEALVMEAQARAQARVTVLPSEVLRVQRRSLPLQVPMTGTLRAAHTASVKAQYSGRVLDLQVREGEAVRKGQRLFAVAAGDASARVQQAGQQAAAAEAELQAARLQAKNQRALAERGFVSATALANSEAALRAAQAQHRAALAAVEVARKTLGDAQALSPIDGVVAARRVQPGEVVAAGQTVLELVDARRLELHAQVAAADAPRVTAGQQAQLWVEGQNSGQGAGQGGERDKPLTAQVLRVAPSVQGASRNVPVFLQVNADAGTDADAGEPGEKPGAQSDEKPGAQSDEKPAEHPAQPLRDGMFARGEIAVETVQALFVPLTAIRTDQPIPYLLALQDSEEQAGETLATVRQLRVQTGVRVRAEGQVWQAVQAWKSAQGGAQTGLPEQPLEEGTPILAGAAGLLGDGTAVRVLGGE